MNADSTPEPVPCSPGTLRKAIQIYLEHAYEGPAPAYALRHVPPEGDLDVALWLMSDAVERTPSSAGFAETRSFALRLGSVHYRHMKLRLSRPGNKPVLVFTVDVHDAFLEAACDGAEHDGIVELKRRNAETASRITAAWEEGGLPTERTYLRERIRAARERGPKTEPQQP